MIITSKPNKEVFKKFEPGDIIQVHGVSATIKDIYSQEYFPNGNVPGREYFSVEFRDINGNYRNYKSDFDAGLIKNAAGEVMADFTELGPIELPTL